MRGPGRRGDPHQLFVRGQGQRQPRVHQGVVPLTRVEQQPGEVQVGTPKRDAPSKPAENVGALGPPRRRRRESNPCTGLCRPLPKPLGHSATEALPAAERPAQKTHHGSREPWVSPDGVRRLRADDGIRTRDPHLGKVMLYQLSHVRVPASKTDGRRNSARHANRTVADPGRVANSGSISAAPAAPPCVRVATYCQRSAGNRPLITAHMPPMSQPEGIDVAYPQGPGYDNGGARSASACARSPRG